MLVLLCALSEVPRAQQQTAKRITWQDVGPFHARLEAQGVTASSFPAFVQQLRETHDRRVREGDLDHLVFYLLQSPRFTSLPPIEPALSAKSLVDSLDAKEREEFLRTSRAPAPRIPAAVRSRITALLRTLSGPGGDLRVTYFRSLVNAAFPEAAGRETALAAEYLRVMRFVYEKEFVAQRSQQSSAAVAELYRTRGLSTDTAVEAGFLVYQGLGILRGLEPARRVRRVLIVGPGLDLAPRTAFLDLSAAESYQPWAVIDALLTLELSRADDLTVVAADINPRVVEHLRRAQGSPPALTLVSEVRDSDTVSLSQDYRDYFAKLGLRITIAKPGRASSAESLDGLAALVGKGHLMKRVQVSQEAARTLQAHTLDIVTERLDGPPFDLVIATNILPYFDDVELMLAMSNVAGMLSTGGVLLHNEARPSMHEIATAVGLPVEQSRHAVIATVRGAPAPLFDGVFLHRKRSR